MMAEILTSITLAASSVLALSDGIDIISRCNGFNVKNVIEKSH